MDKIKVFDSSLRDGAQAEGISFSVEDKLRIAAELDKLGVSYIEAGNPASNPKDIEFFRRLKKESFSSAKIVAFGSTRRPYTAAADDRNLRDILSADTKAVSVFGKSWDFHVTDVIHTELSENIKMIQDSVFFLKSMGKEVIYDAEHFFDGYKNNKEYALETLKAARTADCICLCDTNGGTFPHFVSKIVEEIAALFPNITIGIHAHNDCGMAVSNSVSAVMAGARHVQGTLTGFGERCGNADLSTVIPNLQLKLQYGCLDEGKIEYLTQAARVVGEIANGSPNDKAPFVGRSAFAHKGGMHVDGVLKDPKSFEHIDPSLAGNERRFLVSEVAGRKTILPKIQKIAPSTDKDDPKVAEIIEKLKTREHMGYQFEGADATVDILIRKQLGKYTKFFKLLDYNIISAHDTPAKAMIKIAVGEDTKMTAAEGEGPVDALDKAMRKALLGFYPVLSEVKLIDYKVRVLNIKSEFPTASKVRVLITSSDSEEHWTTVGVSEDIIEASRFALTDSIDYKLNKNK
ncbi:citramalate synthase [Clostridia bacterium]|nr:citramalate synthase [Clostridia bacterium]